MATPETVPIADEIMSDFEDVSSPNSPSLSLEQSTRGSTPPTSTSSPPSTQNNDSKSKESLETDDVQDTVDNKKLSDDVNESQESTDSKDNQDGEETRKESTDAKDIKSGGTKKNQDSKDTKESKKIKKSKPISRAPIATGISTEIEVTGEKPKPIQEGDPSLEDDVLYAIFVILYEEDSTEKGMTVKHITDVLDEKYPQFTKNTGKVSNLVSAKINSYIKRLEAGQTSLRYAISRDWGTNTPKRMLYRYRGILAPGWEVKLKELQKQQESKQQQQQQEQQSEEQQNEQHSDDSQELNSEQIEQQQQNESKEKSRSPGSESPKSRKKVSRAQSVSTNFKDHFAELDKQQDQFSLPSPTTATSTSTSTSKTATKRRATMFDLGRPTFLTNGEFCDQPPPYLTRKPAKIEDVLDEDVLEDDEESLTTLSQKDDSSNNIIKIKKRRLTWAPLGETGDDDLGLAAFRALSTSTDNGSVSSTDRKKKWFQMTELPKPELTSLSELEKYWD
ncbi:hypothetical protein MGQ_04036 [Candida albicans P76067]|nr:hypothetical protein MGQ_04036 [Candida albicans P76067]